MTEKRVRDRRNGVDRRKSADRRVNRLDEVKWLPPYGRRKLDNADSRKSERRVLNRRS